jgi:hypothetical protein
MPVIWAGVVVREAGTPAEKSVHLTAGEGFGDGSIIDLLQSGKLILWKGKREVVSESITHVGKTFRATPLPEGLPIPVPATSAAYGSTADLFQRINSVFLETGVPEETASLLGYFVFCTWFSDLLAWVPSLLLHGEQADCVFIVSQLQALCRRSLLVSDFNKQCLQQIPLDYCPTVIVVQRCLTRSAEYLLANTLLRGGRMKVADRLASFDCPRVVLWSGVHSNSAVEASSLKIRIPACHEGSTRSADVASRLQPQLLHYRLRNWRSVRDSGFSAEHFTSGTRQIAVSLGRCVIDQELQRKVIHLLEIRDQQFRSDRTRTREAAVIDSLLVLCSEERDSVVVAEVAQLSGELLRSQGEANLQPRAIGEVLRSLRLETRRKCGGYTLELSQKTRERIHELAQEFDVLSVNPGTHSCSTCARPNKKEPSILAETGGRNG